ncbi:phage terminase small subunit [Paenibacillus solani]|uniref:phage terminase small subunit n=1 Tax=Paenibacillus solani TaxID=1705565 RepID=UPI003D26F1FB
MARARDPNRDRALEIWQKHGGNITNRQIAEQLGVDEKKIAVWKQRDKWNVNVVQQTDSNVVQQKKRGAPRGNKNAVGNSSGAPEGNKRAVGNKGGPGGPHGNKKAVTTGEYETIWLDALEEDEQELIDQVDTDPVQQADEAIKLLTIRERRMLQRIGKLMNGLTEKQRRVLNELKAIKDVMTVHDEKSGVTRSVPVTRTDMVESQIEETEYRAIDDILKIEDALTRVQAQKLKAVELKNRLIDDEKQIRTALLQIELNKQQGAAGATQSWTDALKEIAERRKAKRAEVLANE